MQFMKTFWNQTYDWLQKRNYFSWFFITYHFQLKKRHFWGILCIFEDNFTDQTDSDDSWHKTLKVRQLIFLFFGQRKNDGMNLTVFSKHKDFPSSMLIFGQNILLSRTQTASWKIIKYSLMSNDFCCGTVLAPLKTAVCK